ncbi:MAG: hypothetical protein M1830_006168 [Pleopsidium flavum]|nr:MAG: hypothetical protein M1830_006168 [Pleopsidium flavum]
MAELPASEIQYQQAHISDDRTTSIIVSNVICFVAACVAVSLRLISRRLSVVSMQADDYMILVALVRKPSLGLKGLIVSGFLAVSFISLHYGLGKHAILQKDPVAFAKVCVVPLFHFYMLSTTFLTVLSQSKATLAAEALYAPGIAPVKFSILLLYHRLFRNRRLNVALWCVGAFVLCMTIAAVPLAIFACVPIKGIWDPTVKSRCINFNTWIIFHGSQNVVTDFLILCLPIPLVWKLNMATSRKVQVTGIFMLGGFTTLASIIRLFSLDKVSFTDASWADVGGNLWSTVELCMGIVSACLPTLGPIGKVFFPKRQKKYFTPDQTTRSPNGDKSVSSKVPWADFRPVNHGNTSTARAFTLLDGSQEEFRSNWTTIAPSNKERSTDEGGMELNYRRCNDGEEQGQPMNSIKVTTDLEQNTFNSGKVMLPM